MRHKSYPYHFKLMFTPIISLLLLISSCHKASAPSTSSSGAVATDWYRLQLRIFLTSSPQVSPLVVGRNLGYVGIGLYESVRPGIRNSVSLTESLFEMPAMPSTENNNGYSWPVAANAAMADMVRMFYSASLSQQHLNSIDSLEEAYNNSLRPNSQSTVFARSQAYGKAIAKAVFDWSKTDNANFSNAGYTPPVFPGAWVPTPNGFAGAAAPYFGQTRPFLAAHIQDKSPATTYTYSEDPSSDFYKMVKDIYDVSQTLTPEQRTTALYWDDVGTNKGYTPPGHAFSIITQVLENSNADLSLAAQVYAKTGIAMHDAFIMCWRSKYKYSVLRPVTYIRKLIDPAWSPVINTPNHPECFAAHAFISSAPLQTLTEMLGDHHAFTDNTYSNLGFVPRQYASYNDAAAEAGMSRRYGGIHYLPSIQSGLLYGRECGSKAAALTLIR